MERNSALPAAATGVLTPGARGENPGTSIPCWNWGTAAHRVALVCPVFVFLASANLGVGPEQVIRAPNLGVGPEQVIRAQRFPNPVIDHIACCMRIWRPEIQRKKFRHRARPKFGHCL